MTTTVLKVLLRLGVGLVCLVSVWLLAGSSVRDLLDPPSNELADLPIDGSGRAGTDESEPIFMVEVASRPDYRLAAFDPTSTATTPVFVVPEFGVISSVGLSPDRSQLALAYTRDYTVPGSGIYLLDATTRADRVSGELDLREVTPEQPSGSFDTVRFAPDGATLWATLEEAHGSAVVAVDLLTGKVNKVIDNAVEPAPGDGWIAYLTLDPDGSRRSIGLLDLTTGTATTIPVLEGGYDLGNLLADTEQDRLVFTALLPSEETGIQVGDPALAHGSHEGPAQWLTLDLASNQVRRLLEHEPMTVRDATMLASGEVAASTADGLIFVSDPPHLIVDSRRITELAS